MDTKKSLFSWRRIRLFLALLTALLSLAAFADLGGAFLMQLQAVPVLLRLLASHAWGALATLVALLLATAVCGRVYCAILCPLGILQDALGWLGHRLRHVLAGFALVLLGCGYATVFFDVDPYSIFGRLLGSFSLGAFLPPAVLLALVAARPRAFCHKLCPVGALLGLMSRHAIFRIAINRDSCTRCGKCVAACSAGCLNLKAGTVDNDRCYRCFNCLDACEHHAISFTRKRPAATPEQTLAARRDFLANLGLVAAGAVAGIPLVSQIRRKSEATAASLGDSILPPGAGDAQRLATTCTGCQLCVSACRQKGSGIIVIRNGLPTLNLTTAPCPPDCHACAQACPTGALERLGDKRSWAIATAVYQPKSCLVATSPDSECLHCQKACPHGAIAPVKAADGRIFPRFSEAECTGCGMCFQECPADAIVMSALPQARQRRAVTDARIAQNARRTVVFDPTRCRVLQQERNCGHCARVCPTGAITLRRRKSGLEIPRLNPEYCIACKACEHACPVSPKAMTVVIPAPEQEVSQP